MFSDSASEEYDASTRVTAPLVAIMMMQGRELPNREEILGRRREVKAEREEGLKNKVVRVDLELPEETARRRRQASEKGASSWLSVLPLSEQGFTLSKGEFKDALALRYEDTISDLPSQCPCGDSFNMTHALNCKRGGFIIMRHNNIRDFEANLMRRICNDVEVEPRLQPLEGEVINGLEGDEVRPDIRARGVWRNAQNAYFDVRVTNINSPSQQAMPPDKLYKKHEQEKKRQYNDRIMNVEHGTFTPLIFATNGGAGPEAHTFHKHLADKIAEKTGERYEAIMTWIWCKLSFIILRACLTCLRGSRPHRNLNENSIPADFALACEDARLQI